MSKIIMEGFRTDKTLPNIEAILTKNLFWYDKVSGTLKVGNKVLNYYIEIVDGVESKILTTLSQSEEPNKIIKPLEFSTLDPI